MVLSEEKKREYIRRLMLSRMRILCNNGFYGLLLMHMNFALEELCDTAATDGKKIYFGPKFLDELSDSELDFILMHEILHVVLKHCTRTGDRDNDQFNIACDIVVNSNIMKSCGMNPMSITLRKYGESMHLTPKKDEGYLYTAEQVYAMLPAVTGKPKPFFSGRNGDCGKNGNCGKNGDGNNNEKTEESCDDNQDKSEKNACWDDHTKWGTYAEDDSLNDEWVKHLEDACQAMSVRDPSNARGTVPGCAIRLLNELHKAQTDWRQILDEFVQEEICDYSFNPPDRRFGDSPFFLPDFNETEFSVKDILFMIDTSGSMSDKMITAAFSEVKGALDQFNGYLKGWLGFFDASVTEPVAFSSVDELKVIHPIGGGGTSFSVIFRYVERHMADNPPAAIIILTDGYAPFPNEKLAGGVPVLWLLNNGEVNPPWGKVARIEVNQ